MNPFQAGIQETAFGVAPGGSSAVTVVNPPGGTTNALPKWTGAASLGDSAASENGTTFTITDRVGVISKDVGVAHTPVWTIQNPGPATVGVQKWSGVFRQRAYVWDTTLANGTTPFDFDMQVETIQGTTALKAAILRIGSSKDGAAQIDNLLLFSSGGVGAAAAADPGAGNFGTAATKGYNIDIGATSTPAVFVSGGVLQFGSGSWATVRARALTTYNMIINGVSSFVLTQTVLQLGGADNAALPVSHTIRGPDTIATTADVAGGSLTYRAGIGRGNAAPATHIFQASVAVASGTGIQTNATRFTIGGTEVAAVVPISQKTHAAFASSAGFLDSGAVQTTDATVTTVYTLTIADTTVHTIDVTVTGRGTAAVERGSWQRRTAVYREGGGAVIGATITIGTDYETTAGMDVTVAVSGNDVLVQVTGIAATTINWVANVRRQAVSGSA